MSADADGIKNFFQPTPFSVDSLPFLFFSRLVIRILIRRYRQIEGIRRNKIRLIFPIDWRVCAKTWCTEGRVSYEFTIRLEESNSSGYSSVSMRRSSSLPCLEKRGRLTPSSWRNVQEAGLSRVERRGGTSGNDWPRSFYDFGRQMKILGAVRATSTHALYTYYTRGRQSLAEEFQRFWLRARFNSMDDYRCRSIFFLPFSLPYSIRSISAFRSRDENWNRSMIVWIFRDWRAEEEGMIRFFRFSSVLFKHY